MAGIPSNAESTLSACFDAGVLLRRPKEGLMRPILAKGEPDPALLERVKTHREQIAAHLESHFAALDELCADAQSECEERGGVCADPDRCPWFYECQTKRSKNANKC